MAPRLALPMMGHVSFCFGGEPHGPPKAAIMCRYQKPKPMQGGSQLVTNQHIFADTKHGFADVL